MYPLQEILLRPEKEDFVMGYECLKMTLKSQRTSSEIHIKSISLGLKVKRGHKSSRSTIKVKVLDQPGDAAQL